MIKVIHIHYATESGGSAAVRIQKAFSKANIDSGIVSLESDDVEGTEKITYLGKRARFISRVDIRLQMYLTRNAKKEYGLFSYPVLGTNVAKLDEVKNADIIFIHWALRGLLNLKSIKQIAALNKPVILFMHDMWFITGGCHYSFDCEKYITGCNKCPVFLSEKINDLAAKEFGKKIKLYSKYSNLYFVSPSKWLYNCVKQSLLAKNKSVFYIPNILDDTMFKPFDKNTARQILNIDAAETVIAFGAVTVESPYKGWEYLQKALEILSHTESSQKITVLIFGSSYNKQIADAIPFNTKFMGYLRDEYSTSLVYNAADVFIAPSLAEAFGYVVMEALSCGTPVVGFNIGGIPDMIKHKENGYLANYKDAEDLANGIKFCLQTKPKGYLPAELAPALTIQKYLDLFSQFKII